MNNIRIFAIALLIPFAALTLDFFMDAGYIEIFDYQRRSSAGWQVFADLAIALLMILSWLIPDARKTGRNPWPWVLMTPFIGSISPLLYLATGKGASQNN